MFFAVVVVSHSVFSFAIIASYDHRSLFVSLVATQNDMWSCGIRWPLESSKSLLNQDLKADLFRPFLCLLPLITWKLMVEPTLSLFRVDTSFSHTRPDMVVTMPSSPGLSVLEKTE